MTHPPRRSTRWRSVAVATLLAALGSASAARPVGAQDGPPPEVRAVIRSVEQMLLGDDEASLRTFVAERLAPSLRAQFTADSLLGRLRALRQAVGGRIDDVAVERTGDGLRLMLSGATEVTLLLALDGDARLTRLDREVRAATPPSAMEALVAEVRWETLPEVMRRAEADGFSGVMLARREGREVLRAAYGVADRATGRRIGLETIFGIGSTPIDFTVTGVLLLGQRGRLALDDSVGKYLTGVPADKRGITLRHLMTGRSGLRNFHDAPGDWDADLAWIDRETAVRRILAAPLLFAPGTGEEHSHSAFGLLAAVIEVVSGRSYAEFTRAEILAPLGMTRTGFYGETLGLDVADFATGYGASAVGLPNIPPNWGPTSWLVMGSGGMFSTLTDMERYYAAIDAGRLLSGAWAEWQQGEGAGAGGSDRGFFILRATNARGTEVLFLMNGEGRASAARALSRAVERLVFGR